MPQPRYGDVYGGPPPPSSEHHQAVVNAKWPPHPDRYRDQPRIPVRARLVFDRDGETWVDAGAVR